MSKPNIPDDYPYMVEVDKHDGIVREWSQWANLNASMEQPYYRFATWREAEERLEMTAGWKTQIPYAIYHWRDGRWRRCRSTTQECPT